MLKELFASVGIFLASIFGGDPVAAVPPSLNQPASAIVALSGAPDLFGPATSSETTTVINQYITRPVIEREVLAQYAVTREELDASLAALRSDLSIMANNLPRAYSFSGAATYTPVSTATFAQSQKIDKLSGATLSNVTISGVSGLTTSDIGGFAFATASDVTSFPAIAMWGDSLTYGYGGGATSIPSALSSLTGYYVHNGGNPGENSSQIASRMLADTGKHSWPTIIWAGRNNYSSPSTVKADIAEMVATLTTTNYVILGVVNGDTSSEYQGGANYTTIATLNSDLATTYGSHFLDIRTHLVSLYDPNDAQDVIDHGRDIPPSSLRNDYIHFNAAGYSAIAQYIYDHFSIAHTTNNNVITADALASVFNNPPAIGGETPNIGNFSSISLGGLPVLYASSTNYSTVVGMAGMVLFSSSTPINNTAVGYRALYSNNLSGNDNSAFGWQALSVNTTGNKNTALGRGTLGSNTTGSNNTAVGYNALPVNTSGSYNLALGYQSLYLNQTGSSNIGIGVQAGGYGNAASTALAGNIAIGYQAGYGMAGNYNLFLGYKAASSTTSGNNNIAIGYDVDLPSSTGSNQLNIGNLIYGTNVDGTGPTISTGNVGIGTSTPSYKLDVAGFVNTDQYGGYKQAGNTILYASSTNFSTLVGYQAGNAALSSASLNYVTAIGDLALSSASLTGSGNSAVGYSALKLNSTGAFNTAVGYGTLLNNTSGGSNSALGTQTLYNMTSGTANSALGFQAGYYNRTGSNNTIIGYQALFQNSSATNTIAIGYRAGYGNGVQYSNQGGTYLGFQSGYSLSSSSDYNTLIGYNSGYGVTTGTKNILIGPSLIPDSYNQLTTGSNNVAIGYNIALPSATASNQLNIGNLIYGTNVDGSGTTVSTGSIGIGTTTPWRKLSVTGTVGLDGLTGSTGAGSLCLSANREVVYNSASDACLPSLRETKHDISLLSLDALQIVDALDPVSFVYNDGDGRVRYGFIAEDTADVDPHLVTYSASGTLSGIDDRSIISIVVKAIQELMARVQGFADRFATSELTFVRGEGDTLSTRELTTEKLCIGSTCVTEAQLQSLLANTGNADGFPAPVEEDDAIDTEAPVITISGNNPALISVGDVYNDLGATVTDNVDINLGYRIFVGETPVEQAHIDTSEPNEWHIHYVANDNAGNTATSTRTVIVEAPSITPSDAPEESSGDEDETTPASEPAPL